MSFHDPNLPDQSDDDFAISDELTAWSWNGGPVRLAEPRELPRLRRRPRTNEWIVVGGGSELLSTSSDTTEIFDEESRTWRPGPPLKARHRDAEVVELQDASLLVIGGSDSRTKTGSPTVEILRAGENVWQLVAPMREARIAHAACLLSDGRVLVTGGQSDPDTFLDSCEIYDPHVDSWEPGPPLSEVRATHHLRQLRDGSVMAIGGGTDITATRTTEVFDASDGTWAPTSSMMHPRWGFASALLDDGRVLVAGGRVPAQKGASISDDQMIILSSVEAYSPGEDRWSSLCPMLVPRTMGIPNVELGGLPDGRLLFPGGRTYPPPYHGTTSVEAYDPLENTWSMLAPMRIGASYHAFATLASGEVLTAGGRGPRFLPLRKTEIFGRAAQR